MADIELVCPNCGEKIRVREGRDKYYCCYCGAAIVNEAEKNLSPEAAALLDRAYEFLAVFDFENAELYCRRVLDLAPHCAKAYMGLLMCLLRCRRISDLEKLHKELGQYPEYQKALAYASGAEKENYRRLNDRISESEVFRISLHGNDDEEAQEAMKSFAGQKKTPFLCLEKFRIRADGRCIGSVPDNFREEISEWTDLGARPVFREFTVYGGTDENPPLSCYLELQFVR